MTPWGEIINKGSKDQGAIINMIAGDKEARALKAAQGKARTDLTQGYDKATSFQQPIYDTGIGAYTDVAGGYKSGGFDTNQNWDPNSVFEDPEFQASMRAGKAAIGTNQNASGTMFSTASDRDLTGFGQDLFARRSDELYGRKERGDINRFSEGMQIAQPGFGAANNMSDIAAIKGENLANNSLGSGVIRAKNIGNTAAGFTTITDGSDFGNMLGGGGGKTEKGKKA